MLLHRLLVSSSLYALGYVARAQEPATCAEPNEHSSAIEACAASFATAECGGRNDSRGNCENALSSCESECGDDCGCERTRTGCSCTISVSCCQVSSVYDVECASPLASLPDCVEGYAVYDTGGCVGRNELGVFRNVESAALCAAKCDEDESCVSFEYLKGEEYNASTRRRSCQLSTSCDRLSLTANDSSGQYLWYVKDSKFTTPEPTPRPTSRPTTKPVPSCDFCASGVTDSSAPLDILGLEGAGNSPTCGQFELFLALDPDFPIPCPIATALEGICCPSPVEEEMEEEANEAENDTISSYPDCDVSRPEFIGDGKCHSKGGGYNTVECGYDGGDCLEFNEKYPDCMNAFAPYAIGDGKCSSGYNNEACGYDGGDCLEFNEKYPDCDVNVPSLVGNGECNADVDTLTSLVSYNVSECGYDGGDCLEAVPTSSPSLSPEKPAPSRTDTPSGIAAQTLSPSHKPTVAAGLESGAGSCGDSFEPVTCTSNIFSDDYCPTALSSCQSVCGGTCECKQTFGCRDGPGCSEIECVDSDIDPDETSQPSMKPTPSPATSSPISASPTAEPISTSSGPTSSAPITSPPTPESISASSEPTASPLFAPATSSPISATPNAEPISTSLGPTSSAPITSPPTSESISASSEPTASPLFAPTPSKIATSTTEPSESSPTLSPNLRSSSSPAIIQSAPSDDKEGEDAGVAATNEDSTTITITQTEQPIISPADSGSDGSVPLDAETTDDPEPVSRGSSATYLREGLIFASISIIPLLTLF